LFAFSNGVVAITGLEAVICDVSSAGQGQVEGVIGPVLAVWLLMNGHEVVLVMSSEEKG
jgi:hypothetical protein